MRADILIVEDNSHDLEFTLAALEQCRPGYNVIVTRDGEEALDYLLSRKRFANRMPGNPTLILLDLKLPKIDGVEVLKIIRFTPALVDIPVIILSTSNEDVDLRRTRTLGIADYLVKPMSYHEFERSLCKAVSEHAA